MTDAEIGNLLLLHQDSLQYLDIFRNKSGGFRDPFNLRMGRLSGFKKLRRLCIQPEALLGAPLMGNTAGFSLRETLPQALTSLTLYYHLGSQYLAQQLEDVVDDERYIRLSAVNLEDVYNPTV